MLDDGPEKGVEVIEVRTGGGLQFAVTPTKGLDFGPASFGGTPLSWQAPPGEVHPMYYETEGAGWLRTASGGLMMTYGRGNVGSPSAYGGRWRGMHGRAHHTTARQVCAQGVWHGDEYEMTISGIMEDAALFGPRLRLHREISARLGINRIIVRDRLVNDGFEPAPYMLLYHFNYGFPLLSGEMEILLPPGSTEPREAGLPPEDMRRWQEPEVYCEERVYYHTPDAEERAEAVIFKPRFPQAGGRNVPLTLKLSWRTDTLPQLIQWRIPRTGIYALGIEPASCRVEGMAAEAAAGRVRQIQPGAAAVFEWELNIG